MSTTEAPGPIEPSRTEEPFPIAAAIHDLRSCPAYQELRRASESLSRRELFEFVNTAKDMDPAEAKAAFPKVHQALLDAYFALPDDVRRRMRLRCADLSRPAVATLCYPNWWDSDQSGGSASWDRVVRLLEDAET